MYHIYDRMDPDRIQNKKNGHRQIIPRESLIYIFIVLFNSFFGLNTVQCRHLIPALNAWAARAYYTTARPIATQFPGHGCMDDFATERRKFENCVGC